MEQKDNIQYCLAQLCHRYLDKKKAYINQPKYSRHNTRKILQRRLFNTLFSTLKGPYNTSPDSCVQKETCGTVLGLYNHVHKLQQQQNYDDANELQQLADIVFKGDEVQTQVVRLLLALADTAQSGTGTVIGTNVFKLTHTHPRKSDNRQLLPAGPRHYGDSKMIRKLEDNYFMHFPNEVFDTVSVPVSLQTSHTVLDADIFSQTPGTGLPFIFSTKNEKTGYTQENASSLFGGLLHSRIHALDVTLDLPELPDVGQITGLKAPKILDVAGDEGYASTLSSLSTPTEYSCVGPSSAGSPDLWDTVSHTLAPHRHLSWETVGRASFERERGFVSESGVEVFERLCRLRCQMLQLLEPDSVVPVPRRLSMKQLVQDALYLLLGVPSHTFLLNVGNQEFCVTPSVYIPGLSTECVRAACEPLLQCGSHYRRLEAFSQPTDMQALHCRGLIFQAFTDGIRRYLQHYRGCIVSVSADKTLLELQFLLHTVMSQMSFLAELCGCALTEKPRPQPLQDGHFPTGLQLVSYVYKECLDASNCHHYPMLLSLLHSTAKPFLIFLQDWAFQGIHRDLYGEFMIQVDENYLEYRDESYWALGFRMMNEDAVVPLFLKDIAHDVFVCGKSINLLKLIDPKHFLLRMEKEYPAVRISFSEEDLSLLETRCLMYSSKMKEMARQHRHTRQEMLAAEVRANQELAIRARHTAAAEVERLQEKAEAVKAAQDQKKRKLFTELKSQMEKDLLRRATKLETEKSEDAERVVSLGRQEVVEARVNEELEKEAREEMIEYYARLSAEATEREQRALWHVRRKQLAEVRREFLEREERMLAGQLEQTSLGQITEENTTDEVIIPVNPDTEKASSVLLENTNTLPTWAKEGLVSDSTQHVSATEEPGRKVWTQEGSNLLSPSTETDENLPRWASQNLGSGETMVVDGDVVAAEKPHPSQSSIQDVLYQTGEGVSDPPRPVYATDRAHPSQTSKAGLLKLDTMEKTGKAKAKEDFVTVEDLKKAQELHQEYTGQTGVQEVKHASVSVIQDLMYPQPEVTSAAKKLDDLCIEAEVQKQLQIKQQSHIKSPSYKAQVKTHVKVDEQRHATTESRQETVFKSSVKLQEPHPVNKPSDSSEGAPHIKFVAGVHSTLESVGEDKVKSHIKQVSQRGSFVESSGDLEERKVKKAVAGKHFSQQSKQEQVVPKTSYRINPERHANLQSGPVVVTVKKRSLFGHVSQLSGGDYQILAPKMKKQLWHANKESDWFSYQVKSCRRKVPGHAVNAMSEAEVKQRPLIRVSGAMHVSQESTNVDIEEDRMTKFRQHNIHGHASDSSAQRLLYGTDYGSGTLARTEELHTEVIKTSAAEDMHFFTDSEIMRYQDNFDILTSAPQVDLQVVNFLSGGLTLTSDLDEDTAAHDYVSLPTLLRRSVITPLLSQITLVNEDVLSVFHTELLIDRHFEALRRFMLMQDGEFGHSLSHQLFDKLSQSPSRTEMFNPVFLNSTLQTALRASLQGDNVYAANLSFVLKRLAAILKHNSPGALDGLELSYKVNWPLNIVISDSSISLYGRVFSFMLLLKRAAWSLKDVWTRLKRDAVVGKAALGPQYTRLQLIRHEMQHFAQAMQGYISNQVIHVAWQEFQEQLNSHVHSLDELHDKHMAYLHNCQARCLLNKKCHKVMQVIESIFALILKLRVQLVGGSWCCAADTGHMEHPHYEQICHTYQSFSEHSRFLFRVVNKIALRGYKPYLQELINRLNFNGYYQSDKETY